MDDGICHHETEDPIDKICNGKMSEICKYMEDFELDTHEDFDLLKKIIRKVSKIHKNKSAKLLGYISSNYSFSLEETMSILECFKFELNDGSPNFFQNACERFKEYNPGISVDHSFNEKMLKQKIDELKNFKDITFYYTSDIVERMLNNKKITIPKKEIDVFGAIKKDKLELVQCAFEYMHQPIDEKDEKGNGYLHCAVENGNERIAIYLINIIQMDRTSKNNDMNTPIHIAFEKQNTNIIRLLIPLWKYIDLSNLVNKDGQNPMHIASQGECQIDSFSIQRLFQHPEVKDNTGNSFIHYLCATPENYKVLSDLIKGYFPLDVNITNYDGNTPLHIACENNCVETVKVLLNEGNADPNKQNIAGNTPLHLACQYNKKEIVKILLEDNKTCLMKNKDGETPTIIALHNESTSILQYLVKIDMLIPNNLYKSIYSAVINKDEYCVKYLVEAIGLSIHELFTKNNETYEVFYLACEQGSDDIVKYMLSKSKSLLHSRSRAHSPLYYSLKAKQESVVDILVKNGAYKPDIKQSIDSLYWDIPMEKIISDDMNEEEKYNLILFCIEERYDTPTEEILIKACQLGYKRIVVYLLNKLDPVSKDITLLYVAFYYSCHSKSIDLVKYFIDDCHVDVCAIYSESETPLSAALSYSTLDVVKYIFANAKDIESLIHPGKPAIHSPTYSYYKYLYSVKDNLTDEDKNGIKDKINLLKENHAKTIDVDSFNEWGKDEKLLDIINESPKYMVIDQSKFDKIQFLVEEKYEEVNDEHLFSCLEYIDHDKCYVDIFKYFIQIINLKVQKLFQSSEKSYDKYGLYLPTNRESQTVLHIACRKNQINLVKYLVNENESCKVNIESKDIYNRTPLFEACLSSPEIAEYLIAKKANKYCVDVNKNTPFMYAFQKLLQSDNTKLDNIKKLINIFYPNNTHHMFSNNKKLRSILFRSNSKLLEEKYIRDLFDLQIINITDLEQACLSGSKDLVTKLYEQLKEENGNILDKLHQTKESFDNSNYAIVNNHVATASYSIIHNACQSLSMDLVNYLLDELEFSPYLLNSKRQTILHTTILGIQKDKDKDPNVIDFINTLIQKRLGNFNVLIENDINGDTPVSLALKRGLSNIAMKLFNQIRINKLPLLDSDKMQIVQSAVTCGDMGLLKYIIKECNMKSQKLVQILTNSKSCEVVKYYWKQYNDKITDNNTIGTNLSYVYKMIFEDWIDSEIYQKIIKLPGFKSQFKGKDYIGMTKSLAVIQYELFSDHQNNFELLRTKLELFNKYQNNICEILLNNYYTTKIINGTSYYMGKTILISLLKNPDIKLANPEMIIKFACQNNQIELLHIIYNFQLNNVNDDNETYDANSNAYLECLNMACKFGNLHVVKYLLEILMIRMKKIKESRSLSPLHSACASGNIMLVKYLFEYNVIIKSLDKKCFGKTALHIACKNGNYPIVNFLIEKFKSDPNILYSFYNTLKYENTSNENISTESSTMFAVNEEGTSQENTEIIEQKKDIMQEAMKKFVNQKDNDGKTPIIYASTSGSLDIFKLLEENGAKLDQYDMTKRSCLHYACENSYLPIIDILMNQDDLGILYKKDLNGESPLAIAMKNQFLNVLFYLQPYTRKRIHNGMPFLVKKNFSQQTLKKFPKL